MTCAGIVSHEEFEADKSSLRRMLLDFQTDNARVSLSDAGSLPHGSCAAARLEQGLWFACKVLLPVLSVSCPSAVMAGCVSLRCAVAQPHSCPAACRQSDLNRNDRQSNIPKHICADKSVGQIPAMLHVSQHQAERPLELLCMSLCKPGLQNLLSLVPHPG